MTMLKAFITLLFTCTLLYTYAQITAVELIDKSIHYHDPEGLLEMGEVSLYFTESRPNSPDRQTTVSLNPWGETFSLIRNSSDKKIISSLGGGLYTYTVDGVSPTQEEITPTDLPTVDLNSCGPIITTYGICR